MSVNAGGNRPFGARLGWISLGLVAALAFSLAAVAAEKEPGAPELSKEETIRLGERIYRDGILPSGEPMMATVRGDIVIEGTMFSCSSCHLRGGLGSNEGRVATLPTNGRSLYQPYDDVRTPFTTIEKNFNKFRAAYRRPAYTDETLADVLRLGIDPTGRELDPTMPRYDLKAADMAILIAYLKNLSSETPPGVTESTIRFATVIAGEVSAEDQRAMLLPLESFVRERSARTVGIGRRIRMRATTEGLALASRGMSLSRWELTGPPETWRAQLEEHYRKEPVFALLGGISSGEWRPIHAFCEENGIPCILPVTDYPVITETDYYTLYFSKGLYQEGEAAARYLMREMGDAPGTSIVQAYRDSKRARALADGFRETWKELGLPAPAETVVGQKDAITAGFLRGLAAGNENAVLLLWAGPETYPALEALAAGGKRPGRIFVSSSLLGQEFEKLPDPARDFTFITYPYRFPQEEGIYANPARAWLAAKKIPLNDRRIATRMYSLCGLLSQALGNMRQNIYRDNFLDSFSILADQQLPDYERLSFGPGQQYASKGCYIVQLDRGKKFYLLKKSDWVIH
jgi:hypothetical protein